MTDEVSTYASGAWSSVKGSWRRTKEKALRKVDKDRQRQVYDEEYDKMYANIAHLSQQTDRIGKDMKKYLDSQRTLHAITYKLAGDIIDCTESRSTIRPAAVKFHSIAKFHGDAEENTGREERFLKKAYTPWVEHMELFHKLKKDEDDRNDKELDYHSYQNKVKDLQLHPDQDPERLPRNEKKLIERKQIFESMHYPLKAEIFDTWNKRYQTTEIPLREALSSHIRMCKQMAEGFRPAKEMTNA
eukprot:TRINITY_DN2797_c0_g1_i1.p1 TRINITY_DN2797_c0_g1~~TRINITY_DN2797_c0_g1_i1.p1  ORF type:complete len:244 (-),score=56.56 TRINITY_DN2797_c0_g1_i1:265-996(-)